MVKYFMATSSSKAFPNDLKISDPLVLDLKNDLALEKDVYQEFFQFLLDIRKFLVF